MRGCLFSIGSAGVVLGPHFQCPIILHLTPSGAWRIIPKMDDAGVGLFGGTFDPIHCGHLIVARSIREQLSLQSIVFIPAARPPHKGHAPMTTPEHRLEMVRLSVEGEEGLTYDDCELHRPGPSYTYQTVVDFRQRLGAAAPLYWIIGADLSAELGTWYRIRELLQGCGMVTVSRPGWDEPDLSALASVLDAGQIARLREGITRGPRIDISATDIRRRVAAGRSIRFLVPEPVRHYIEQHGLYRLPELPRTE